MGKASSQRCGVKTDVRASWANILASVLLRIVIGVLAIVWWGDHVVEYLTGTGLPKWIALIYKGAVAILVLLSAIFALIGVLQDPKL